MAPSLLTYLTGIILLVSATGQGQNKNNCDFDPDIIFFEDEVLEKLKNSFQVNGECSPAVWKNEFNTHLQNQVNGGKLKPLSEKDRTTLNGLSGNQRTLNKQRQRHSFNPRQPQFQRPRDVHYSHRGARNLAIKNIHEHEEHQQEFHNNFLHSVKRHIPHSPDYFMLHHPRELWSSEEFFEHGNKRFERMPQDESNFSSDIRGRPQNHRHTEEFFRDDGSRRPQNQRNFITSNVQRRSQTQGQPDNFLGNNNGRNPPNDDNILQINDQRNWQNQGRPGDFSGSNNGGRSTFIPPGNQRRPQNGESPQDFFSGNGMRPQNQGTFFPSDDQRRPQNQGQSGDFFGINNQREGQNQENPNDFFRPDGHRRPQQFNGNQNTFDNQRQIPQTTTQRPQSTTLPGPPTWATSASPCVRQCPNTPEYNPVCGSDRVTYRNPGRLRCEQRCGKAFVVVNHYGNCITTTAAARPTTPSTSSASRRTTSTTPPTFSRNMG